MQLKHPKLESRKINKRAVLAITGIILLAIGYVLISLSLQDQNDQRVAKSVMAAKGTADFRYLGPKWIPESIRSSIPGLIRVCNVHVIQPEVPDNLLTAIGTLRQVDWLDLGGTSITDEGLRKLDRMSSVKRLVIRSSKVTDAGLVHLKGMHLVELDASDLEITDAALDQLKNQSQLKSLGLTNTKTTPAGRATLRKALPACEITPDP